MRNKDNATGPASPDSLWGVLGYKSWLTSEISGSFSDAIRTFLTPLLILGATGNPALAGGVASIGLVVRALAGLAGGLLADRLKRYRLMLVGSVISVALSGAWVLFDLIGALTVPTLFALHILFSLRIALLRPASGALLVNLVGRDKLGRATAVNQGREAATALSGPPAGGALLTAGGWLAAPLLLVLYLISLLWTLILGKSANRFCAPQQEQENQKQNPPSSLLRETLAGFIWSFRRPDIRTCMIVLFILNVGFTTAMTTVIYSMEMQGTDEWLIGLVAASAGIGMFVGTFAAGSLVPRLPGGLIACASLVLTAGMLVVLSTVSHPLAVMLILGFGAIATPVFNSVMNGYITTAIPNNLLGRVSSALMIFTLGGTAIAPAAAGIGLGLVTREHLFLLSSGLVCIGLLLLIVTPSLRKIPKEKDWVNHAQRFT